MDIIDQIANAEMGKGGVYVIPGVYLFEIQSATFGVSRKKREFFVVELKTLESDQPTRPVGSKQSWMVMLDNDAAPRNIKEFLAAASNTDPDSLSKEDIKEAVSEDQPLKGQKVRVVAENKQTKRGTDFTLVRWAPVAPTQS